MVNAKLLEPSTPSARAIRAARPRPRPVPAASAPPAIARLAPTSRSAPIEAPRARTPVPRTEASARILPDAWIPETTTSSATSPLAPELLATLDEVKALAVRAPVALARETSLAELRGYRRDDLFAVAELAYHYLMNGGLVLARVLFDGLAAVAPSEPYFALGLGLAADRMGDRDTAKRAYRRAGELDPEDGLPDLDLAELHLDEGDLVNARALLRSAIGKSRARGDDALVRKGTAILGNLERSLRAG